MSHLSPDELVAAAEGTLDAARLAHLDVCATCRQEAHAIEGVWREAAELDLPEPSPLFWDHFPARVQAAIQVESLASAPSWMAAVRWPSVVPLGALALMVVMAVASVPQGAYRSDSPVSGQNSGIDGVATAGVGDGEWYALAELVGPLDWDAADAAGLAVAPGDADRALADLDDDERRELTQLIAGELARAKS